MSNFSDEVMQYFLTPVNVGEIDDPDAFGEVGSIQCGDMVRLYFSIKNGIITSVRFKTYGCATMIASTSVLTEMIDQQPVDYALSVTTEDISKRLGSLPEDKMHCPGTAVSALQEALKEPHFRC